MVLLGAGVCWYPRLKRSLHGEDYAFEKQAAASAKADGSGELAQPQQYWLIGFKDRELEGEYLDERKGDGSGDLVPPQQYWLIGFKDRELEGAYLDELAAVSKSRVFCAYFLALLFVIVVQLGHNLSYLISVTQSSLQGVLEVAEDDPELEEVVEDLTHGLFLGFFALSASVPLLLDLWACWNDFHLSPQLPP
eukprot:CAMPEP_0197499468 /NCGR_PEP_ID=MMETSP1311-20131121/61036_1 /TAXON_ID=464262 /ORGANISM="Genus nov. species nov., Strain RCC856" /LENGTH=192 /DNA_ID=CAMNT_0043045213 /DNA_START=193 /DNA_END=767 /DNA_ORIENTATION=-